MKIKFSNRSNVPALLTGCIVAASIGLIAWAGNPGIAGRGYFKQDTVPAKEGKGIQDFDKELRRLDEAQKQLLELQSKNWERFHSDLEKSLSKIDPEKLQLQMQAALNRVDMEKIGKEIEEAMSKLDFSKIQKDLDAAMIDFSKIDREKINREVEKARKEVNEQLQKKEWQKEIEEVKKIDMNEIQEEMENAKKEMERIKEELKIEKLDMKKAMSEATAGIDEARAELKGYQEMVHAMEKEGLLTTAKDYIIRYHDGELIINGSKQPDNTGDRYKKYFKNRSVTIKKEDGKLSIDND